MGKFKKYNKFSKFNKNRKRRKRKKKFIIEIRTRNSWQRVELLKDTGTCFLVKCLNGEILRRKYSSRIRLGKTKLISGNKAVRTWPRLSVESR